MTTEMPDFENLLDIIYRINEELEISFNETAKQFELSEAQFIQSIKDSNPTHRLVLSTTGNCFEITYSGIVIFKSSESNALDTEDYIRFHLDILMNMIYNGNLLNDDILFCKDMDSKEFYLT